MDKTTSGLDISVLRFLKTNRVDWPGTRRAISYALTRKYPYDKMGKKELEKVIAVDEKDLRRIVKAKTVQVVFEAWRIYWEGESAKAREKGPGNGRS